MVTWIQDKKKNFQEQEVQEVVSVQVVKNIQVIQYK